MWTRDTGTWLSPVTEASAGESGNVTCGDDDGKKRKGVGRHDANEEGGSVVCAGG